MSLDFSTERWDIVAENYTEWWNGTLKRPIISIQTGGRDAGRPQPTLPYHFFVSFYDLSVAPEDIIDTHDYVLSTVKYLGDSFPKWSSYFGPGVAAAFLGADLENSINSGTTWFKPKEIQDISSVNFKYDPENVWFQRVKAIYTAAKERWGDMVHYDMTDLGGNLDILSSFRPSENLLYDLYDHPDEVKRLTWQAHDMWWKYFDELNELLMPPNRGYSCWAPMWSPEPYYMLQCDFCYMIGPDMFDEFVKPELEATCKKLKNAFYHLDGIGELPHLDSLLQIKELKGIQWVPGDGQPDCSHWPEVYKKIRDAGKLIQALGSPKVLDDLVEQLGTGEGICMAAFAESESEARSFVDKYYR